MKMVPHSAAFRLSLFPTGAGASSSRSQYLAPASIAAASSRSACC